MKKRLDMSDYFMRTSFVLLGGGNTLVYKEFGLTPAIITSLICAGIILFIAAMSDLIISELKKNIDRP